MSTITVPPLNPAISTKIQPKLMKDTYKKVHIYLFDFDILLGKGSFSKVYKGINLNTNEQVAVKVIEMSSINTTKLKQLLVQQIDILMKVKHENLIKCFEVLSSSKNTYIIMQLCLHDFGTICDFIQKQQEERKKTFMENLNNKFLHQNQQEINHFYLKPKSNNRNFEENNKINHLNKHTHLQSLSESINSISSTKSVQFNDESDDFENNQIKSSSKKLQTLKQQKFYPFIKQIFLGLQYMSRQNIVHRDLKLSNIFLINNTTCKIGDFGFATIIPQNKFQIKDSCCIGSPLYMSPQSYLQNIYSLKSDIWSFGILIFEMIYGNPPHWNCPTHEILKSQVKKPINLSKFQKLAKISQQMKQVLEGCLRIEVRKRFSIEQLRQTKLFRRLLFEPLQSEVIIKKRNESGIQQSSVQILKRAHQDKQFTHQQSASQKSQFQYSNYSCIQKVKQGFRDIDFLKLGNESYFPNKNQVQVRSNSRQPFHQDRQASKQIQSRRYTKLNTFNPNQNNQDLMTNNSSFTDRNNGYKNEMDNRFKTTDLNGNIFKQVNRLNQDKNNNQTKKYEQSQKENLYKNSSNLQKYLQNMKSYRPSQNNYKYQVKKGNQITFNDLSNIQIYSNSKDTHIKQNNYLKQTQSPKFSSTFNGPFFNYKAHNQNQNVFNEISKNKNIKEGAENSSFCNAADSSKNKQKSYKNNDLLARNRSCMFDSKDINLDFKSKTNNERAISSPRCQTNYTNAKFQNNFNNYSSLKQNKNKQYKQNYDIKLTDYKKEIKQQKQIKNDDSLLRKNYSAGHFSSFNSKQQNYNSSKYQYKSKLLQKCTSSPKFETIQAQISTDRNNKSTITNNNNLKHMTTSSFYGNTPYTASSKNKQKQYSTLIKQFNMKQELSKNSQKKQDIFLKTFDGSVNFLNQFSSKLKQKPCNIQKKTYFKGGKNLNINLEDKNNKKQQEKQVKQNNQPYSIVNTARNASYLFPTSPQKHYLQENSIGQKQKQHQKISIFNFFKLLPGQIIVKDACELINFSRILHKISFITENNYNSITLLQYSIQILCNLQQKCQNFQIKYHYDSSVNNSLQIREAFKLNQIYLNNLNQINQKQCYSIKREASSDKHEGQKIFNKTNQLKNIIQSYAKKFSMRKQALVKLFQCNALFQNLTNKVKQTKYSSTTPKSQASKPELKRRASLNSQKGFLNFSKLQNILQQIKIEIQNKKYLKSTTENDPLSTKANSLTNSKILIYLTNLIIASISKCTKDKCFKQLSQNLKVFQAQRDKSKMNEGVKQLDRLDKQAIQVIKIVKSSYSSQKGSYDCQGIETAKQQNFRSIIQIVLQRIALDEKRNSQLRVNKGVNQKRVLIM